MELPEAIKHRKEDHRLVRCTKYENVKFCKEFFKGLKVKGKVWFGIRACDHCEFYWRNRDPSTHYVKVDADSYEIYNKTTGAGD